MDLPAKQFGILLVATITLELQIRNCKENGMDLMEQTVNLSMSATVYFQ